jgi:UDP-2,4-diacetamido-2,4,6-trideoxy-beta-L-altropyranose hydrolase
MMKKDLIVRVDAGGVVGYGHLVRCVTFVQRWKECGGDAIFITNRMGADYLKDCKDTDNKIVIIREDRESLEVVNGYSDRSECILIDGYGYNYEYQKALREAVNPLVIIDDYAHQSAYCADVVINQNYAGKDYSYKNDVEARYYFGCEYALLAKEYTSGMHATRVNDDCRRILIIMGGNDEYNYSETVLDALIESPSYGKSEIKIAMGINNKYYDHICNKYDGCRNIMIMGRQNSLYDHYAWSDLVITAGGISLWECLQVGKPAVVVVTQENQRNNAEMLASDGIVKCVVGRNSFTKNILRAVYEVKNRGVRREMLKKGGELGIGSKTKTMVNNIYNYA